MKTAIMQPYFCAYIGYYQLIYSVDKFVIYDNIEYTKKGWFNRNRILLNGSDKLFTIPIKSDSDFLHVKERYLSDNSLKERRKILSQIRNSYLKAPYYNEVFSFIENLFLQENQNLFDFIYFSVKEICDLLDINTDIIISSKLNINHSLKSQDKVIEICRYLNTDTYVNPIGGKPLYDRDSFRAYNIDLKFLRPRRIEYPQFSNAFIPWLSIIDVLMFNGIEITKKMLQEFDFE